MQAVLDRPTREEDGVLRRLHCLERLGAELAAPMEQLKDEIRARDRRREVREPDELTVVDVLWTP